MAKGCMLAGSELVAVDHAIRVAEQRTRVEFSVYVGPATGQARSFAQSLHGALTIPDLSVLVLVDPYARQVEIVVGSRVTPRLPDRELTPVIDEMCRCFRNDELAQGVIRGVLRLARATRGRETVAKSLPAATVV